MSSKPTSVPGVTPARVLGIIAVVILVIGVVAYAVLGRTGTAAFDIGYKPAPISKHSYFYFGKIKPLTPAQEAKRQELIAQLG